jgi:hypothetical protein
MSSFSFKESKDNTSRPCTHFALFSSNDVGNCIGGNPEFAKMGHPKGLTDKAVVDILIISDSQEDFGSDVNDESSESESECESQRGLCAEVELSTGSVDATTVQKKQRVEEWKLNPSCLSHDKPTKKHFCGVLGINGSIGLCLSEEVKPVHVFNLFMESDFCLHLVAQVNKYAVSTTGQNDSGSSNSSMKRGLTLQ